MVIPVQSGSGLQPVPDTHKGIVAKIRAANASSLQPLNLNLYSQSAGTEYQLKLN